MIAVIAQSQILLEVIEEDIFQGLIVTLFVLQKQVTKFSVKSKTVQKGMVEVNAEVRMKDSDTGFINRLSELPGVKSAVLVSYNGDYMG